MSLIVGIAVDLFDADYRTTKASKDRCFDVQLFISRGGSSKPTRKTSAASQDFVFALRGLDDPNADFLRVGFHCVRNVMS